MPRFTKTPGWRSRLSARIEACRRDPHAFGRHDCALFAADCVLAMTGEDPAAGYRGRYRSASGALRVLKDAGHADLPALVVSMFGEAIHPSKVRAGDIAAFPSEPTGWALGIVTGERVTVLRPDGLGTLPLTAAAKAFRIP